MASTTRNPLTGTALQRFLHGLGYVFRGIRHVGRHPRLLPLVLAPAFVNFVIFISAAVVGVSQATRLLGHFWSRPDGVGLLVAWIGVQILVALAAVTLCFVLVWAVSGLIATPFNDRLAELVEQQVRGTEDTPFVWRVFLRDIRTSLAHSILNLGVYVVVMACILVVDLLPAVGMVVGPVLSWLATSFFLAREMIDGPLTRRGFSWGAKMGVVNQHRALMLGFGSGAGLLLWIPLLNFLCLPVAVVGGTLMFCELEGEGGIRGEA